MSPNRLPRIDGFSYRGQFRYFLTVGVVRQRSIFSDLTAAQEIADHLVRCVDRFEFEVLAYCVMPDLVHALLEGTSEGSDLLRLAHAWKQGTGFDWKQQRGERLWRAGFHERALRSDEPSEALIDGIWKNPIRAGLVVHANEYALSFRGASAAGPVGL